MTERLSSGCGAMSRRVAVLGAGGTIIALAVTACGSGGGDSTLKAVSGNGPVPAAEIPVGGAVYLPDMSVIITQPTKGTFKAFSSVCTHQGCAVTELQGKNLHCPCHGSLFDLSTGAVTGGPAPAPLPSKKATVQGGNVAVS